MTDAQKDEIYRMVWFKHVCEDVESLLEDEKSDLNEDEKKKQYAKKLHTNMYIAGNTTAIFHIGLI